MSEDDNQRAVDAAGEELVALGSNALALLDVLKSDDPTPAAVRMLAATFRQTSTRLTELAKLFDALADTGERNGW